ncbi:MAG: PLP-dependent aminotransferase family protein [Actinomycetia bacterium]|nr:PLP-dependent aminotransferase family protein [Actinomycetes bacterium]
MSKKITFDYWKHLYADRIANMYSSEIRDLLALSARPDIISFAGGNPEVKSLNFQKLEKYIKRALTIDGDISLQYSSSEGYYPFKTKLREVMKLENIEADEEDMVITTGGQQALDLLAKVFINPGDLIIVEAPSYAGAINSFKSYQPQIIGIPVDSKGIKADLVEQKLQQLQKDNKAVKFIYLVPNFSNPSGVTLSLARRKKILSLAQQYNTVIIEDNPYGMLRYEGKPVPCIKHLDQEQDDMHVIYMSTLSKLLAPGFRIGWVVAPHLIIQKLTLGVQAADLCTSTFSQRIAFEYFSDPGWIDNIDRFKIIYSERRNAMLDTLSETFPPGCSWSKPEGGFFIWLKLPSYLNTKELLADAVRGKVAYVPGSGFYADGRGKNEARLAFCSENPENIVKGIKILANIIKDKIKLYKSFN